MTPEHVLGALVTHSQQLDLGKPDPSMIAAREGKVGKVRPMNWRLMIGRKGNDDKVEIWPSIRTALGTQTPCATSHRVAEVAADALCGMHVRNWYTLQCAIGIGDAVRPMLANKLLRIAYRLKNEERIWPDKVRRRQCACGRYPNQDYVPDLVELSIRELEYPFLYKTHRVKHEWFGVSEAHWHARVRQPYDAVSAHIWYWYHAGIGHIQHRIVQCKRSG